MNLIVGKLKSVAQHFMLLKIKRIKANFKSRDKY